MSALVCGKRSPSSFDDDPIHEHQQASKRSRRCSPRTLSFEIADRISRLQSMFPLMDHQLIERVLEASGNDLDLAIRSLNDLQLVSAEGNLVCAATASDTGIKTNIQHLGDGDAYGSTNVQSGIPGDVSSNVKEEGVSANDACMDGLPRNGFEWVELLVREMMGAPDVDDVKVRASRVLELLEKSITSNASGTEAMQGLHKENILLKDQVERLLKENNVLKRAVAIQHERQKEYEGKSQELQHLKQLASQYQEKLTKLEVSNYTLAMHLQQAQQSHSMPGRYHPDVF